MATASRVDLGSVAGAYTRTVTDPVLTTDHEVRVTGLVAGQEGGELAGGPSQVEGPERGEEYAKDDQGGGEDRGSVTGGGGSSHLISSVRARRMW